MFKRDRGGAREVAKQVKALAALSEDWSSVPSTIIYSLTTIKPPALCDLKPSLAFATTHIRV